MCIWYLGRDIDCTEWDTDCTELGPYGDCATGWTVRGSSPRIGKNFLSPPHRQDQYWDVATYSVGTAVLSRR